MRQLISGMIAAVAVVAASTVPVSACGLLQSGCSPCGQVYSPCAQPVYVAPQPVYVAPAVSCNSGCGGWTRERLADPVQQYYYVNQGPTYSGPAAWAPEPVYREETVSDGMYYHHRRHHYGYHHGYHHAPMGYAPMAHHSLRYGTMPHHYRQHTLRRYY